MLDISGLRKTFGDHNVLRDVSIQVGQGDIVALLGPSGSGKTTTLRMIAGFDQPDSGSISIGGKDILRLRPYERNIGVVFQDYALFPHMSVLDNVCYGPRRRGSSRKEAAEKAREYLALVRLKGFENRWPTSLSGGQQQRVALARALAISPEVLLLDEPLSALDSKLRVEIRGELREILVAANCATIIVTHDQDEAMSLAERICVMNEGCIVQAGSARELYQKPHDRFVAEFVGRSNLFTGRLSDDGTFFQSAEGLTMPWPFAGATGRSEPVSFLVRPERIELLASGEADAAMAIKGRILQRMYLGQDEEFTIALAGGGQVSVVQRSRSEGALAVGSEVGLRILPENIIRLPQSPKA
jgi:putative spermidine/putrescine transport system ATP-binding protein/putrescine transport system ATP-binding protein